MTPKHVASAGVFERGKEFGPADFLVTLWAELGQNQFSLIIPKPITPSLLHHEDLTEQRFFAFGRRKCFPAPLACGQIEATQFAKAADTINITIPNHGSAHGC